MPPRGPTARHGAQVSPDGEAQLERTITKGHAVLLALAVFATIVIASTVIFGASRAAQGWSYLDAFYFTVVTFATIGFERGVLLILIERSPSEQLPMRRAAASVLKALVTLVMLLEIFSEIFLGVNKAKDQTYIVVQILDTTWKFH